MLNMINQFESTSLKKREEKTIAPFVFYADFDKHER